MTSNENKSLYAKNKLFASKKHSKNKSQKLSQSSTSTSSGNFFVTSSETNVSSSQKRQYPDTNWKEQNKPKQKFDKKKWRLKKYSKKYKLEQWENKRKKQVLREYYKELKDDEPKFNVQDIYEKYGSEEDENENNLNEDLSLPSTEVTTATEAAKEDSKVKKNSAFKSAKYEFQRIQAEKQRRKEEISQKREERAEALKKYKAQKLEKYKKLNKKTKKGQPIMKYRMEMLLEQIQKSMS